MSVMAFCEFSPKGFAADKDLFIFFYYYLFFIFYFFNVDIKTEYIFGIYQKNS